MGGNHFTRWVLLFDQFWKMVSSLSLGNLCRYLCHNNSYIKRVHLFDVAGTSIGPIFVSMLLDFDLEYSFHYVGVIVCCLRMFI